MVKRAGILMAGALLAALAGCDDNKSAVPPPPPLTGRANAVTAKETAAPPPAPTVTAHHTGGPARQLCAGQSPRPAPKGTLETAVAAGAEAPPARLPIGVGKWVWINLWAAWCAPCREEMPRIVGWQEKLRKAGVMIDLAFVSLDDDERQTHRFLEAQPATGVRATYWLPESDRSAWLAALGLKGTTELPVQALVAPSGQVACVIQGAVEEGDYPAIAAFLGGKK